MGRSRGRTRIIARTVVGTRAIYRGISAGRVVWEGNEVNFDDFGVALHVALDEDFVFRDRDHRDVEDVVCGERVRDREDRAIAGDVAVGGDGAVGAGWWWAGWCSGGDVEGCGGVGDGWDGAGEGNGERDVRVVHADVGRRGSYDRGAVAGKGVAADYGIVEALFGVGGKEAARTGFA